MGGRNINKQASEWVRTLINAWGEGRRPPPPREKRDTPELSGGRAFWEQVRFSFCSPCVQYSSQYVPIFHYLNLLHLKLSGTRACAWWYFQCVVPNCSQYVPNFPQASSSCAREHQTLNLFLSDKVRSFWQCCLWRPELGCGGYVGDEERRRRGTVEEVVVMEYIRSVANGRILAAVFRRWRIGVLKSRMGVPLLVASSSFPCTE